MLAANSRRSYDQIVTTACGVCPAGCGVKFFVQNGRVVDLYGDETHPVNRGALCARGQAFIQHFDHPARRRQPALRRALDQELAPCGWEEALNLAASGLKAIADAHGPEAVAVITADRAEASNRFGAARLAARLGARLLEAEPSAPDDVAEEMCGAQAGPSLTVPPAQWTQSNCLLLLGGDPAVDYPIAFREVLATQSRQIPIIAAAPRLTATLSKAELALQIRPGTEAVLLFALAKVAFEEGLPGAAVAGRLGDLDQWRAAAEKLTWGDIERSTWLPEESLRRAGLLWAAHQPGVLVGGGVVSRNTARAAAGLLAVSGALSDAGTDRVGGWNWLAEAPWPFVTEAGSEKASGAIPIKAVVGSGNFWPLLQARGEIAPELVVQLGTFPDETQRHAHVTFPAASWAEVEGVHVSHGCRVQRLVPVLAPPGEARASLAFWAALADRLGTGDAFPWRGADGGVDLRAWAEWIVQESPKLAGMSLQDVLPTGGVQWPREPALNLARISLGAPPKIAAPELDPARPLLLFRDTPAQGDAAWWPWLHQDADTAGFGMHPQLAERLGLSNGDSLVVDDGRHRYAGRAHLSYAVPLRAIWAFNGIPRTSPALALLPQEESSLSLARLRSLFSEAERQT